MSVRASYGLGYDFGNGETFLNTTNAPPWSSQLTLNVPAGGFENPWLGIPGGNPYPLTPGKNTPFTPNGPFIAVDYDTKTPYIQSGTRYPTPDRSRLDCVRELHRKHNTSHVGSAGAELRHLFPAGNMLDQRRYIYTLLHATPISSNAVASRSKGRQQQHCTRRSGPAGRMERLRNYNGMLLNIQRRSAKGTTIAANYTLSRCIGDLNVGYTTINTGTGYTNPADRKYDRGNCTGDKRHLFNLTSVAQTPTFSNTTLKALASEWKLAAIFKSPAALISQLPAVRMARRMESVPSGRIRVAILIAPTRATRRI